MKSLTKQLNKKLCFVLLMIIYSQYYISFHDQYAENFSKANFYSPEL